ncbi:hypothetical protein PG989_001312 [Apiospora arundinis]
MAPLPSIAPAGLAAATLAVTVVLGALSIVTVTLRIYVRSSIKALALDDYLMTIGLLFFVACCTFTSMDVYSGLGHHDVAFTTGLSKDDSYFLTVHAAKWLVFFQITYAWSLPFIKSSICWALLRFTTARRYVYPLWAVMIFSVGITFVGFVAVMVNCTPFAASWDPSGRISQISYVISAISVITDWACAIIPAFVIWGVEDEQEPQDHSDVYPGFRASISTIVRLPYLQFYNVPTDYYYNVCNIVIWSIVECGVGIIAGSLPSLRPLLKKIPMFGSKRSYAYRSGSNDTPNQIKMNNLGHAGGRSLATCHGGEDESKWERLDDNSSQQYIIMKNTQVDVEYGHSK